MTTKNATRAGWLLVTILLGLSPASALAKDICVRSSDGDSFVFSKVQTLRPGRVVPLTGIRLASFPSARPVAPVHGSAVMDGEGTVHIGVLVHTMSPALNQPSSSFLVSVDANAQFTGSGTFDGAGDFRPTGSLTWTGIDCSSIEIP